MCGITGVVALNGQRVDPPAIKAMSDALAHRGPDGQGTLVGCEAADGLDLRRFRDPMEARGCAGIRLALGHRRLAILDLSERGLQPMTVQGRTWITFNGEIYNHRELRGELESRGYEFASRTDTEVLLRAYECWGDDCVRRLRGMFAFAIWDDVRGRLFCARDRLGIKPFYYATCHGFFLFASEIKALLAFPAFDRTPNDRAVLDFLVHGNCDCHDRTVYRQVRALPGGCVLTLAPPGGDVRVRQYWELRADATEPARGPDCIGQLRDLLMETTRQHLISDVRAGSCLSGGLDSSTVVGLVGQVRRDQPDAARSIGTQLRTFTSCYDVAAIDERDYAMAAARSVDASSYLVFPAPQDFWADFHRLAWHQDMPFAGLSFYAQWRVMRAAANAGVKVLLDGQGGDEVFGGYAKFRYAYVLSLLRSGSVIRAGHEIAATVRQADRYVLDLRNGYRYLPPRLRRFLRLDSLLTKVMQVDWAALLADDSTPATRWWRHASEPSNGMSPVQRIQIDDIVLDSLPQLLRMEDRSSMAFSLEARVPLLDHHVVEFGLALDDRWKIRDGWSKYAVREAMKTIVPDVVRLRKTKLPFAAPDRLWLRDSLRTQVRELLADDLRCRKYVDVDGVRRWYDSPAALAANTESYLGLFRILSLEMWMRAFAIC